MSVSHSVSSPHGIVFGGGFWGRSGESSPTDRGRVHPSAGSPINAVRIGTHTTAITTYGFRGPGLKLGSKTPCSIRSSTEEDPESLLFYFTEIPFGFRCVRVPKPPSGSMTGLEGLRTQKQLQFITRKGYRLKITKGKDTWGRHPGVLVLSHESHLILPTTTCDNTCKGLRLGKLIKP